MMSISIVTVFPQQNIQVALFSITYTFKIKSSYKFLELLVLPFVYITIVFQQIKLTEWHSLPSEDYILGKAMDTKMSVSIWPVSIR